MQPDQRWLVITRWLAGCRAEALRVAGEAGVWAAARREDTVWRPEERVERAER